MSDFSSSELICVLYALLSREEALRSSLIKEFYRFCFFYKTIDREQSMSRKQIQISIAKMKFIAAALSDVESVRKKTERRLK